MILDGPALTKDHEGYRPDIYLDSLGYPTHGYGFLLDGSHPYKSVKEYHDKKFAEEYSKAESYYEKLGLDLDTVRRCAVVDLLYNLGPNRFSKFIATLAALMRGDFDGAASNLENSLWFKQVGRRGPRICKLIRYGTWDCLSNV